MTKGRIPLPLKIIVMAVVGKGLYVSSTQLGFHVPYYLSLNGILQQDVCGCLCFAYYAAGAVPCPTYLYLI
jgi:hypothetical protein